MATRDVLEALGEQMSFAESDAGQIQIDNIYDRNQSTQIMRARPVGKFTVQRGTSRAPSSLGIARLASLPVDPVIPNDIEDKVKAIADHGLLHDSIVEEIDCNRQLLKDPTLIALLERYDANGDGEISTEEISHIFNDLIRKKKYINYMKQVILFAAISFLILLAANAGLTLWMLKITKAVDTNNDRNYLTNTKGNLVVTDKPRYYVSITDLPKLPQTALNSLTRLSFTTVDKVLHNYDVQGIEFGPDNGTVRVFFLYSKQLVVHGLEAVYSSVLNNGQTKHVNVATDNDVIYQRRLQLVEGLNDESSRDLAHRCSQVDGVCYHTIEEMKHLNGIGPSFGPNPLVDAEIDVHGNRRLSASQAAVTYAEISADAVALSADSKSALSAASDFLKGIFSKVNISTSNTTVVTFQMLDRCINYPTLFSSCLRAAPSLQRDVVYNASQDPYSFPPLFGLTSQDGKWYFNDAVTYSKDINTIQVKVRYAHDPLSNRRMHVVMVDRNSPEHILSYDEVENSDGSKAITNYQAHPLVDSGIINLEQNSSRRLQAVEDAFRGHITTKLAGFPNIKIPEQLVGVNIDESQISIGNKHNEDFSVPWDGRKLAESTSSNSISIDAQISGASYLLAPLNDTQKAALGTVVDALPCLRVDNFSTPGISDPAALFFAVGVDSVSGLIKWPARSSVTNASDFDHIPILPRADLAAYTNFHSKNTTIDSVHPSKIRTLSTGIQYHLYEEDDTDVESTISSLRGHPSESKAMPEYIRRERIRRQTLQKHLDAHNEALQELKHHVHAFRSGKHLNTYENLAFKCSIPTAKPVIVTVKPTKKSKLKSIYDPYVTAATFQTQKTQWDRQDVTFSFNYLAGGYGDSILNTTDALGAALGGDTSCFRSYRADTLDSECRAFNNAWSGFLGSMISLQTEIEALLTAISYAEKSKDIFEPAQKILGTLIKVRNTMKPLVAIFANIPYGIGSGIQQVFNVYSQVIDMPVSPVNDKISEFTDNLLCPVLKLKMAVNTVGPGLTYISQFSALAQLIVTVASNFPGRSDLTSACRVLSTVVSEIKNYLDTILIPVRSLRVTLETFGNILGLLNIFMSVLDLGVLDLLSGIFNTLGTFLNMKLGVWVPIPYCRTYQSCTWVTWPCGVNWCSCCWGASYPCGTAWCGGNACVTLPDCGITMTYFSFSIQQIIDGAMSVLGIVTDALNSAMKAVLDGLGIKIPTINIPGLPGVQDITNIINFMKNLSLDVFSDFTNYLKNFILKLGIPFPQIPICLKPPSLLPSSIPSNKPLLPSPIPSNKPFLLPTAKP